jgi:hypothetical protein
MQLEEVLLFVHPIFDTVTFELMSSNINIVAVAQVMSVSLFICLIKFSNKWA